MSPEVLRAPRWSLGWSWLFAMSLGSRSAAVGRCRSPASFLTSLRFRVEPEFHQLLRSKDKVLLAVRLIRARSLVALGNEIPPNVRVLIKIVQRNGLEGLVQRMAVLLRNNSKSRKSVPRAIYLRLVAANCGTRLVMTTGRLNA